MHILSERCISLFSKSIGEGFIAMSSLVLGLHVLAFGGMVEEGVGELGVATVAFHGDLTRFDCPVHG